MNVRVFLKCFNYLLWVKNSFLGLGSVILQFRGNKRQFGK